MWVGAHGVFLSPPSYDTISHVASMNLSTGWSSISFGATPVWLWKKSKKPIPRIVARPLSLVNESSFAETSLARNS